MIRTFLSNWQPAVQAIAYIAQVLALIVAGLWTWRIFIKQRNDHARANIKHSAIVVGQTDDHRLVRIEIGVTNVGNVLLAPPRGVTAIQQVAPIPDSVRKVLNLRPDDRKSYKQLPWDTVASISYELDKYQLALDPGETDAILCDFVLPRDVNAIFVCTELECSTPDNLDDKWRATSFHRLPGSVEDQILTIFTKGGSST